VSRCWFCSKVKGKRACPARGGALICTRCCGTNRIVAIRCPSDCIYLHGTHDPKWSSDSQEKESARFFARAFALDRGAAEFYLFLHFVLAHSKNPLVGLDDSELAEVAGSAAATLETRAKGLLYSHPTDRMHLQSAAEWLSRLVVARGRFAEAPEVADGMTVVALRALAESASEHARERGGERYLAKAERLLARDRGAGAPRVDLPDELNEPPRRLIVTP
jgi:hypothetical protein